VVSWCVLGPVRSHIHLGAGGEDGLDAERRGVWGDSGHGGGRGAAVAPRDKEEEVGGERGEGGGIRSLMGRAGMGWGGVRGQGQGLMQGRAGRQVRAVSDHILAGGEEVGRFLKQPEKTEV